MNQDCPSLSLHCLVKSSFTRRNLTNQLSSAPRVVRAMAAHRYTSVEYDCFPAFLLPIASSNSVAWMYQPNMIDVIQLLFAVEVDVLIRSGTAVTEAIGSVDAAESPSAISVRQAIPGKPQEPPVG